MQDLEERRIYGVGGFSLFWIQEYLKQNRAVLSWYFDVGAPHHVLPILAYKAVSKFYRHLVLHSVNSNQGSGMGQKTSTSANVVFNGNDARNPGPEPLSGELLIPLDILEVLLELLDRESLEKASILNKNIHRFVNRVLWSAYFIVFPLEL